MIKARVDSAWWSLNRGVWERVPPNLRESRPARAYSGWLHDLTSRRASREMYLGTFFLRNRPTLELMRRLADRKPQGATLRLAVLGCSVGVEVYSILWCLRRARPDLNIVVVAVDTSSDALAVAEEGVYGPQTADFVHASIFERLSDDEREEMFDWDGDQARVKPWLREGVTWLVGDAADPRLLRDLGTQEFVVANNFLCHMSSDDAERCLRALVQLVSPGGYLFVVGVDLDLRTRVAVDLRWQPVTELIAEIHEGDPSVRADWPWRWWGLEPLDRRRPDWKTRYASVFRIGDGTPIAGPVVGAPLGGARIAPTP